jgi:hypothetical protein
VTPDLCGPEYTTAQAITGALEQILDNLIAHDLDAAGAVCHQAAERVDTLSGVAERQSGTREIRRPAPSRVRSSCLRNQMSTSSAW